MDNLSPSHHDFYSYEISWQEGDTLIRNMFTPLIKSYHIPKDLQKPVGMRTMMRQLILITILNL